MKLLKSVAILIALAVMLTACAPAEQDALMPEATDTATPSETSVFTKPVTVKLGEVTDNTSDADLPTPADDMDILFLAPNTAADGITYQSATFSVYTVSESGTGSDKYFGGGKLTVGEHVYPFILSPDVGIAQVDYVTIVNEEPYKDYFFVQITTVESPVNYTYVYSYDSDLPVGIVNGACTIGRDSVSIEKGLCMFGVWSASREYTFTPGKPGELSPCFTPVQNSLWTATIHDHEREDIAYYRKVVLREFDVYLKTADGKYKKDKLPVDTRFIVTGTDGEHTIFFETFEGVQGYFDNYEYDSEDFRNSTIGGVREDEVIGYYYYQTDAPIPGADYCWEGGTDITRIDDPITADMFDSNQKLTEEQLTEIRALPEYSE